MKRPVVINGRLTPEQLNIIMAHYDQAALPVAGDCLEAVGVENGGWVAVDFTRRPAPPRYQSEGGDGSCDLCLCRAVFPGTRAPAVMCKAYDGVWGPWQMVGTRYADQWSDEGYRMNVGMRALEIYGVVFASWGRDGGLKWQRDPAEFPEKLQDTPTIHGINIGEPMELTTIRRGKV